jgi:hypothetical protein
MSWVSAHGGFDAGETSWNCWARTRFPARDEHAIKSSQKLDVVADRGYFDSEETRVMNILGIGSLLEAMRA